MSIASKCLLAGAAVLALDGEAFSQGFDVGKTEYLSSCAACHGSDANGKASTANQPTADLTQLAKKNGGVFPFGLVYEIIDGRKVVIAHGTRDMPIWGNLYVPNPNNSADPNASDMFVNPSYDPEAIVRMRILAVIGYLARIQEK